MADGKIALITGANKGIGKEIARQLGTQGLTVLIGARDAGRGAEAADELMREGIDARAVLLDVTDQASIAAAADRIKGELGRLDVLVNNAGIALDRVPPSQLDLDTLRRTYDTNVFGVFAVTKAMLPLLRKSDAGRIVNMSSGLGSLTQNSDPDWGFAGAKPLAYNSSKAALNMITVIFAAELKDTPIKVNAADPGFTATDLNQHRGTRTVEQGAAIAVRLATLPPGGPTGGYFDDDGVVPW
ncbi:MAG: SDR family oxidoreductase [Armatimonadetes bacterium]|nr:SDR family oxidoreductase [Armatimonadota bacterium]